MNQPNHPVLSGGTFGAMSGEKPLYDAHVEPTHEHLVKLLKRIGLRFEETHGKYEQPERSVIIYHPRLDQMKMLGKMFGQEAVVFSQGGNHELHYTNGPHEGKKRTVVAGAPPHEWFHEPPSDFYTHLPKTGYFRINFDFSGDPSEDKAQGVPASLNKSADLARVWPHPHNYDWHDGHTDHHQMLVKNDQAAGVGVATYAKYATPFGRIEPGRPSDLMHYDYRNKLADAQELVKKHGFKVHYAGGKFGRPDLANKNYNTNHLMIYDPTPQSGGDFGEQNYTDAWRHVHELAHALTYPEVNKIYGEGRRLGRLGTHRTLNEAMRAVHWEHLAAHKQRELSKMMGVSVPDHVFNKEYNCVMHDAVHRAVTGKFTEPSQEGFIPNSHATPLDVSLDLVRDAANKIGLSGNHQLIKKSELRSPLLKRKLAKAWPKNKEENQTNAMAREVMQDAILEGGGSIESREGHIPISRAGVYGSETPDGTPGWNSCRACGSDFEMESPYNTLCPDCNSANEGGESFRSQRNFGQTTTAPMILDGNIRQVPPEPAVPWSQFGDTGTDVLSERMYGVNPSEDTKGLASKYWRTVGRVAGTESPSPASKIPDRQTMLSALQRSPILGRKKNK